MTNDYKDIAKLRTQTEFVSLSNQMKPIIEQYAERSSKWNGKILLLPGGDSSGGKLWDCGIKLNPDAPLHVLIHELIHSCSVSHFGSQSYAMNRWEEELTVHYLSQELAILMNIPVVKSAYDDGVELIREFKRALKLGWSDLELASELIKQPLGERWNWSKDQVYNTLGMNGTIEQYQELFGKVETIMQWKAF